jgi:dihydrofolate synthase / folylpolyglutamate synthase
VVKFKNLFLPSHITHCMTYQQTIDYLFAQLPMFSKIGAAAYKANLDNTIALCSFLNNPQYKFKSIHIAGTNGKGSTSHMLAAILQQDGYKTGLYTSPHLKDFRERIKINGEEISEQFVIDFVQQTKTLSEQIQPSFFELTVAMAFEYFAQQQVDVAVIETGLGGRLDSTNVISPILSIITNIGYDHVNILGDTLEKIANEKAGIIKPNTPVIIGEYLPQTKNVFEQKATAENAVIYFVQDEYKTSNINYTVDYLSLDVTNTAHNFTEAFKLDLNGMYQAKNLCTVLCAEGILIKQGFTLSTQNEKLALANVKKLTGLHGRWEVIAQNPTVIIDVAHNEDGIKQVINQLAMVSNDSSTYHFVLGMVKDKDIDKVLSILPKNAHYYFSNAQIPRALPHNELQQKAATHNLIGNSFEDVNIAIASAKQQAKVNDVIVVCGSVFLVGEVK